MTSLSVYPLETHGGTVTSWIPLSTLWPSSSGCESYFWSVIPSTLVAWDPGYGLFVNTNIKCFPPAATTWWDQDHLRIDSLTSFSLGPITCPDAYTTATTIAENQSSTFMACCPRDYTFVSIEDQGRTGQCSSDVPAGEVITYAVRDQQQSWFITSTSIQSAMKIWGIQINGYNIAPRITSSSATASTITSTSAATSTSTSTAETPTATVAGTPQSASGLSTGAKAGIGAGVALGALALIALTVFIFVQRKRKLNADSGEPRSNSTGIYMGPVVVNELEERQINELDGRGVPMEMYSRH